MKKLSAFCLSGNADKLLKSLVKLRCLQVEAAPAGEERPIAAAQDERARLSLEKKLSAASDALVLLHKYCAKAAGLVKQPHAVDFEEFASDGALAKAEEIIKETNGISLRLSEIKGESAKLETKISFLAAWKSFDLPCDFEETEYTRTVAGSLPVSTDCALLSCALSENGAVFNLIGEDKSFLYCAVTMLKTESDAALRILASAGFIKAALGESKNTPESERANAAEKLESLKREREELVAGLYERAENYSLAEIYYDYINTELEREISKAKLSATERTVLLTAWVPEKETARVSRALSECGCAFEFTDPAEGDNVPVKLENNRFAKCFEWVLGMYAYPVYGGYDPTFIMSIFYFIIFGIMFADVGYGLVLCLACFLAVKLLKPREGMKRFLLMFGYCGISCIIWGFVFGAYFGDMPIAIGNYMLGANMPETLALWIDPVLSPVEFLIFSLGVGVVHLLAGMGVKAYIMIKRGKWADALFDIGSWYLLFAGIGLVFALPQVGLWVLIAGVASLVLTQGRNEKNLFLKLFKGVGSLYGIVNYVADLLSYSRILALGLAASIVGQVVNILGTMGGGTVIGFIIMIFVFLLGHVLNLAINVLGTFVHTSRLQYIEFFGKFYEDGGTPFKPLSPADKYTRSR